MRILFVAMANSIHTARWIGQLNGLGWDIHLYRAEDYPLHPMLRDLTVHGFLWNRPEWLHHSNRVGGLWRFPVGLDTTKRIMTRFAPQWQESTWQLAHAIRSSQPDIVHSLEMQHAGYMTLEARQHLDGVFPPWIYSSWGSDLFFFGRKPEHEERIRAVLAACDYHIADCQRDVRLARQFGFKGETLGIFPAPGGFDIRDMRRHREDALPSSRRTIALKGYHDDSWAGRGLVALQALHLCADALPGYETVIYLANPIVQHSAAYVSRFTGLPISVLPYSAPEALLQVMGRARISVGVSVSDGTPNTMLEAMIMGAFPIQSDTVSTAEWITHGENGLLVPPEDPHAIAAAVRRALADDALVDRAAELNSRLVMERIDSSVVQPKVIAMYEKIAERSALRAGGHPRLHALRD